MISAIFATCDDEMRLAHALTALVPAATEGVVREAIVVDAGSRDGTLAVADAAGCRIIEEAGADGLRHAAEGARGDWLLFLAPASVLDPGWQSEALAFIDAAVIAGEGRARAASFRLGRVATGWRPRLAEGISVLRSRLFAAPCAEQGLLISREFYRSIGGHRPMAAMADVDLARRVGRRRLTILRSRAMVRQPSGESLGVMRRIRNATCLALLLLHLPPRLIARLAG
jgi:glycosyltransferase involved in cell wall biosynthesis